MRYRSVVVYVYAVKNDLTKWESNLNLDKPFMTNGEFLDALELNQNNIPTINGTGYYVVVVHAFDNTLAIVQVSNGFLLYFLIVL